MESKANLVENKMLTLAIIPLFVGINIGVEAIVKALSLPLFIDSVGTILATILLGWRIGAIVGVLGFIIASILFDPFVIYFIGTQVAISIYVGILSKYGGFKNIFRTIFSGFGLGIVAAVVSSPVIIILFNGATGNGASLIISFFVKMGHQIVKSVLMTGFSIEPIDKALQCLLAYFLIKNIPQNLLIKFRTGTLKNNNFISNE